MKISQSLLKITLAGAIVVSGFLSVYSHFNHSDTDMETSVHKEQLRHIVLFKFNADADPVAVKKVEEAFAALPSKIPQIQDFEWGLNNSPEGLDKGFTHCYLVTFKSEEDRAIYLPHADHQAFVKLLDGLLEDAMVVDYWAK